MREITHVPDNLLGRFDLATLRLFSSVIQDDPDTVLRDVTKLLKPAQYNAMVKSHAFQNQADICSGREVDVSSMQISPNLRTEVFDSAGSLGGESFNFQGNLVAPEPSESAVWSNFKV
ncbi:hypothetical protein F5B18DRAFT_652987 [Nemania serpens]|nr:hypothetical protein F5B18DRAFT_652987 [Nemania serpens]